MSVREGFFAAAAVMFLQSESERVSGRVLDVGCGSKPYKRLFPNLEWTGLDKRPVGELIGDFHDIPADDDTFDTVVCIDALQFAWDPQTVVNEMVRVLKPGGSILVMVPNTQREGQGALWGVKAEGMRHLMSAAALDVSDCVFLNVPAGGIISAEFNDFAEFSKYGLPIADEIRGWVAAMDELYPMMTIGIATKPEDWLGPTGIPEPQP